MKKYILLFPLLWNAFSYAQVGIGTETPEATLDVNGNLIVRNISNATSNSNPTIIVLEDNEFKKMSMSSLGTNPQLSNYNSAVSLNKKTDLASYPIDRNDIWKLIEISNTEVNAGNANRIIDNGYVVPSSGLYYINFELELTESFRNGYISKKIAVLKNDQRIKEASIVGNYIYNPTALTYSISNSFINNIYYLEENDIVKFALNIPSSDYSFSNSTTSYEVNLNIFKIYD